MERKYEFTDETRVYGESILHRIRAVRDFGNVKKGQLGGWIEFESNLSHNGSCWVYNRAIVCDNATVRDNAKILSDAVVSVMANVCGEATVGSSAVVTDRALVYGHATITRNAYVGGHAMVFERATVGDFAKICGNSQVSGDAVVYDSAVVRDNAIVYGDADIKSNACIGGNTVIANGTCMGDDGHVYGNANLSGEAQVFSGADIQCTNDYVTIGPIGSRKDVATFYKSSEGISVTCGCFSGTIEEFEKKVKKFHKGTIFETEYLAAIGFAKIKLSLHDMMKVHSDKN